jgi:capsular exopolysaccharide synthesis family protein
VERIRHALEQAEQDRSKLKAAESGQVVNDATERPERQERPAQPEAVGAATMRFSRTRVVDVDPSILERHRVVSALPDHELTDAYRVLRTRVLQSMNTNHWNSLAVTSPATGSGKTLTAINLAISLAREVNRTVMLADFDLRCPTVHEYFGYQPEFGLSDYLYNDVPIEKILFSPSIDRLVILPGRESIHNSSETLRSPKMEQLVAELKGRYTDRLVLFDLPPILALDDAIAFQPYTDAMLMIAENGATKREDLARALELLHDTPLLGTVLNKSDTALRGGSYKPYGRK